MNKIKILSAFLLLVVCLTFWEIFNRSQALAVHFPTPTGQYTIGTTAYHIIDESRKELYPHESTHPQRELMIQVWYPAVGKKGDIATVPYAPDALHYWATKIQGTHIKSIASLHQIFVHAKHDILVASGIFPVLFFDKYLKNQAINMINIVAMHQEIEVP